MGGEREKTKGGDCIYSRSAMAGYFSEGAGKVTIGNMRVGGSGLGRLTTNGRFAWAETYNIWFIECISDEMHGQRR